MMFRFGFMILSLVLGSQIGSAAPIPKELRDGGKLNGHWELKVQILGSGCSLTNLNLNWDIDGERLIVSSIPEKRMQFVHRTEEGITAYDYVSYDGTIRRCRVERSKGSLKIAMPQDEEGTRPESAKPGLNILYFEFQLAKE